MSEAPIRALPFTHENFKWVFILVLWVLTVRPRLWGTMGQCTAGKNQSWGRRGRGVGGFTFHLDLHRVAVAGGGEAREQARVVLGGVEDRQAVLQLGVPAGVSSPSLRILPKKIHWLPPPKQLRFVSPVVVTHGPFGVAEPPDPETLHVEDCPWIDDQLAVVGLRDGSQLVPEQDGRRLLHGVIILLVQPKTPWFSTIPVPTHAPPLIRSGHRVLPYVDTSTNHHSPRRELHHLLPYLLVVVERNHIGLLIPEDASVVVVHDLRSHQLFGV
jgi:hypothetical protein